jgi:hypothetical protein
MTAAEYLSASRTTPQRDFLSRPAALAVWIAKEKHEPVTRPRSGRKPLLHGTVANSRRQPKSRTSSTILKSNN